MIRGLSIATLLFVAATVARAEIPALPPTFSCQDGEGSSYRIWTQRDASVLQAVEKGVSREIPLSPANVLREAPRTGETQFFNGWNPRGKDLFAMLNLGTEFAVRYRIENGSTRVHVGIVLGHRERTGLSCTASGYSARVVSFESEAPASVRLAGQAAAYARMRTKAGELDLVAVLGIEAILRRAFASSEYSTPPGREGFARNFTVALNPIDPASMKQIAARLEPPLAALLETLLTDTRYRVYPDSSRHAQWIREGFSATPRNYTSIAAGFLRFAESPGSRQGDIKGFFLQEIHPMLKALDEEEIATIRVLGGPTVRAFVTPLWNRAVGKKTKDDYPEIPGMVSELAELADPETFDPQRFQEKLGLILRSKIGANPETLEYFVEDASSYVKQLTPRQREDLKGWLEDSGERELFAELVK